MMLSDAGITERMAVGTSEPWRRLLITPFDDEMLQPQSVDVHLGAVLKVYTGPQMDTRRDNSPWWRVLQPELDLETGEPRTVWVLHPDRFYLAVLREFIQIPEDICGQLGGVSTRARDGVTIHQQAGLLDAGWFGHATLEISVKTPHTIIYPGQRIGQVTFMRLDQRCLRPYRGRYLGNSDPRPAIVDRVGRTADVG